MYYVKLVANDNDQKFVESISSDGSTWIELVKGTYITDTNPAPGSITEVNTGVLSGGSDSWTTWGSLTGSQKISVGGSETAMVIIYGVSSGAICEAYGVPLVKE
jgi:hypothetical protein